MLFSAILRKTISTLSASILATLVAIIIFGSGLLEDYDSNNCNIGNLPEPLDTSAYKLSAQIVFILSIVFAVVFHPSQQEGNKIRYALSTAIGLGIVVSAFMCCYAGATTTCLKDHLINITTNESYVPELIDADTMRITDASESLGGSIIALTAILALQSHDIFKPRGLNEFRLAHTHWPSILDTIVRMIGFILLANFLRKDSNYSSTDSDFSSLSIHSADDALCYAALEEAKHDSDLHHSDDNMKHYILSAAIISGIELLVRMVEFIAKHVHKNESRFAIGCAITARIMTLYSRIAIGIAMCTLIIKNEMLFCEPFIINGEFRTAVGFLLGSLLTSTLQIMMAQSSNALLFVTDPKEADTVYSSRIMEDDSGMDEDMSTSGALYAGLHM